MKKFELTTESIVKWGRTLYRIRALVAFGDVKAGELGGFLEKEENLSQDGDAWVGENAMALEDAWIFGNAVISGNAIISGHAWIFGDATVSENARVLGDTMIFGNATVRGNAAVFGNATLFGNAIVFKNSHYLVIGPMESGKRFITFFRTKELFIDVACGSLSGSIEVFKKITGEIREDDKSTKAYMTAAKLAKMRIDLTPEENEPEE